MTDKNQYLIALSEKLCPLVWDAPLHSLSRQEQVFICVYEVEREVNNGGFAQFFQNSFGQYALETVAALKAIGAGSMAGIVAKAIAEAFPSGELPSDETAREDALDSGGEALMDALNDFDSEFCEYPEDLTSLLFNYVQENCEAIRGAAPV